MRLMRLWVWCLVIPSGTIAAPGSFEVHVEKNVKVVMRDGVNLATDVYRPARNGSPVDERLPVVLTRTPYDKNGNKTPGEYFASHGYVFVAQDTRGRYASEGRWRFLLDDGADGVDCAAWIAAQRWSNGRIGMIGTSYVGGTQHALAMAGSPHLKTIIPVDAVSNPGHQSMRNAGAFELRFWNWIMLNAGRGSNTAADSAVAAALKQMADDRLHYLRHQPLRRGTTPLKLAPDYEEWLVSAMEHGANDAFWDFNNILGHPERYQDMPVYLVGGWYDSWAGNTTANFRVLRHRLKSPVYLIMGPWIHGAQSAFAHGQVNFGPGAAIADQWAWRKEWFDRFLKDQDNTVGKSAPFASPVRVFVMGSGDGGKDDKGRLKHGGAWRDETDWPPPSARSTAFHLRAGGGLTADKPIDRSASTSYVFDPANPVPTVGGNISSADGIMLQGAWNQRTGPHVWNAPQPIALSARNDILVFQTAPLPRDTEVTGEISVTLFVSSSCLDTDFTAKLIDVYPPGGDWPEGFDLNLTDGIVRARHRDSLTQEKRMEPGEVYEVTIKLYPTSNLFKKGHRIRLDISSSNFPRFDVNPNTFEPPNNHRRTRVAVNTIHHDRDHPSRIALPIVGR